MTKQQGNTFYKICRYAEKNNGAMPTLRATAELMNLTHATVKQHIKQLRIKGYLEPRGKLQFTNDGYRLYMQYQLDKIK